MMKSSLDHQRSSSILLFVACAKPTWVSKTLKNCSTCTMWLPVMLDIICLSINKSLCLHARAEGAHSSNINLASIYNSMQLQQNFQGTQWKHD